MDQLLSPQMGTWAEWNTLIIPLLVRSPDDRQIPEVQGPAILVYIEESQAGLKQKMEDVKERLRPRTLTSGMHPHIHTHPQHTHTEGAITCC